MTYGLCKVYGKQNKLKQFIKNLTKQGYPTLWIPIPKEVDEG